MCITRGFLRWGLIAGLALGGATAILGKDRVVSALQHAKHEARAAVDEHLADADNPQVLRRQIAKLADEYPDRIAEVKAELNEVRTQIGDLGRDTQVATTVVAMTTDHLGQLEQRVTLAEAELAAGVQRVSIRFEGSTLDVDEAYEEGHRINKVREAYSNRLAQNEFQRELLQEQEKALVEILATFEDEYDAYRTQLVQLDQQIEAIARNERLIELTEQQQATLDSIRRRGKVDNFNQVEARLAEIRVKQEAKLEQLRRGTVHESYEDRARAALEGRTIRGSNPFATTLDETEESDDDEDADAARTRRDLAFNAPVVIGG